MELLFKDESYTIVGICMEVHRILGEGFNEIIYKDALEYEFKQNGVSFERERRYTIQYKDTVLPHDYIADFSVYNTVLLEIKAIECLTKSHAKQCLNYLAAEKLRLALLINFGEDSLKYQRVVL
ncbi:MAG: GxxExxY protein [Spirochaetota bacterium]